LDTVDLRAEPRTVLGKKVKQLRRQGMVPANLYGFGRASVALQLSERMVSQRLLKASRSSLFSLSLDGDEKQTVLVKQLQRHPISRQVLHVDFYQVRMTEKLRMSVALHFVGEAPAVKATSGMLLTNVTAVEVESLPGDLPTSIEVDVSGLETLDDSILVSDLTLPGGVEVLTPGDEVVAKVLPPTVELEVTEPEQVVAEGEPAGEAEEGEEAGEATAEESST
jgi:large subunit ribosomal protein L25